MNKKRRPFKCSKIPGGRLGEYMWQGLYITRHPEDKKFWAIRDFGDFGPNIEGKFKTLNECCDAIEDWHKKRDLRRNRKHLTLIHGEGG